MCHGPRVKERVQRSMPSTIIKMSEDLLRYQMPDKRDRGPVPKPHVVQPRPIRLGEWPTNVVCNSIIRCLLLITYWGSPEDHYLVLDT